MSRLSIKGGEEAFTCKAAASRAGGRSHSQISDQIFLKKKLKSTEKSCSKTPTEKKKKLTKKRKKVSMLVNRLERVGRHLSLYQI